MKTAKISELKNRLSYYLRFVRRGQTVVVYDRDRPIARLEPIRTPREALGSESWTDELVRAGILRPPLRKLDPDWLNQAVRIDADLVGAILDERQRGR